MKVLKTINKIVSLENVREIVIDTQEDKYTRLGVKITDIIYTIKVFYLDGETVELDCGINQEGKELAAMRFKEMYNILIA